MADFSSIKKLFGITNPKGLSSDEINSIKSIFGNLPQTLIDFYMEFGNEPEVTQTQDSLLLPNDLKYFKHNEYLIFYCENQRVCVWGIHKDDLAKENPLVYMSYDEKEWMPESEKLSDFLLAMSYLQSLFALEYIVDTFRYISAGDVEYIRSNFKSKGVSFKQWTQGIEFYSNYDDSIIIIMGGGEQLMYSSASKEHFTEMDKVLSTLGEEM